MTTRSANAPVRTAAGHGHPVSPTTFARFPMTTLVAVPSEPAAQAREHRKDAFGPHEAPGGSRALLPPPTPRPVRNFPAASPSLALRALSWCSLAADDVLARTFDRFRCPKVSRASVLGPNVAIRPGQSRLAKTSRTPRFELRHRDFGLDVRAHHDMHMVRPHVQRPQPPPSNHAVLANGPVDDAPRPLRKHLRPRHESPRCVPFACRVRPKHRRSIPVVIRVHAAAFIPMKPRPVARPREEVRQRPSHRKCYQSPQRKQGSIERTRPNHRPPRAAQLRFRTANALPNSDLPRRLSLACASGSEKRDILWHVQVRHLHLPPR
jgi:hypothetical protein